MKEQFIDIPLFKNEAKNRFEIEINGYFSFVEYKSLGNQIALVHTETEEALAGTGAASALIEKTLHYLDEHQLKVLPICPFVFAFIQKHPEWKQIVDPKFKKYNEL